MIACDVTEHRELVCWMARTLAACRMSEKAEMFSMDSVRHPCGSPMCITGHALAGIDDKARGHGAMALCRALLQFPIKRVGYLGKDPFDSVVGMKERRGFWWFSPNLSNEEALRRWELTLNYRRRQLAQLEVEAGEWGRSKPARDMPVGRERERRVTELVGGVA